MRTSRTIRMAAYAASLAAWCGWSGMEAKGQADAWITSTAATGGSGNWTNMVGTPGGAVGLPAPGGALGYNGQAARYSQHVRTNGSGQLIFFAVDGNLYDGDGYLIADARAGTYANPQCDQCLEPGVVEFLSIPVPGLCGVYFLLAHKVAAVSSSEYHIQVSVLDMNAENSDYAVPGTCTRRGRLLSFDTEIATLHPQLGDWVNTTECSFENIGIASGNQMATSDRVSKLATNPLGKSQSPMLRVVAGPTSNSPSWLFAVYTTRTLVYKISSAGIHQISPMAAGVGAPADLSSVPTYHTNDVFTAKQFYRDADARYTANGDIRLVQTGGYGYTVWGDPTYRHYNLITMRFNSSTGMLVPNSIQGFSLFEPAPDGCNPGPGNTGLAGCALRPGAAGAYVVGDLTSDCVASAPEFGYLDFASGAFTNLSASVPNVSNYSTARFYRNRDIGGTGEAIYVPVSNGVDIISGIDDPGTVTSTANALTGAVPPLHVDQPGQSSGNLQPMFLNTAIQDDRHLSAASIASCCTYFQTVPGATVGGHTQLPGMQQTWTPASNPYQPGSASMVFNCDLIVEYGAVLNLNSLTLKFTDNAKIIVRRGGRLTTNNTTMTSINCPGARWPGVRVEGNTSNNSQLGLSQGRFWMTNNSVIENAVVGTWCARESANGAIDPQYYGGVVISNSSHYRNCISGARVENYHRFEGGTVELDNLSSFSTTSFRTTNTWPLGPPPFRHAQVANCRGVRFTNCNFVNEIPSNFAVTQRGRGIVSRQAPFRCTGNMLANSKFENLEVGVLAMWMPAGMMYTVNGMTFNNNLKGVVDMGTRDAVIINNKFKMLASPTPINQASIGIHLFQCNGYTIERNTFTDQGTSVGSVGIWFVGPAMEENQIYDNSFTDLNIGCFVQGRHLLPGGLDKPGLQMLCCDYKDNLTDQLIGADGYIKQNQGGSSPQLYANNRYLTTPNCNSTFEPWVHPWHPFDSFVKYHHWDWTGGSDPEMRPECVEDENGVSLTQTGEMYNLQRYNLPVQFDKADHCDAGELDGIFGSGPQQLGQLGAAYRDKMAQLRSAEATYKGTVDHGYTQSLEEAINYQPWHPSHYLRDYMLAKHPLSDEVIKAAIHRAEPLDPWHLTQVLIQNSPLSPEMYRELEVTGALPEFFYNMLMQYKEGVSLRGALEGEIRSRQIEGARLLHQAVWAMNDDSVTVGLRGSLMTMLLEDSTQAGLARRYQFHLGELDFQAAAGMAPTLFVDEWTDALAQLSAVYESRQGEWENTDPGEQQVLFDLAYEQAPYVGAWAWSALVEVGVMDSLPSLELPETFKSLMSRATRYGQHGKTGAPLVTAVPNPARERVQITYQRGMENGILQFFDSQGRLMEHIELNGQLAFFELPLRGYAEGLYMARITLDGFVLGETKFTVVK
ncbi:MAG: NosD domain-containing protein [Flavobacteriales bacterium]